MEEEKSKAPRAPRKTRKKINAELHEQFKQARKEAFMGEFNNLNTICRTLYYLENIKTIYPLIYDKINSRINQDKIVAFLDVMFECSDKEVHFWL